MRRNSAKLLGDKSLLVTQNNVRRDEYTIMPKGYGIAFTVHLYLRFCVVVKSFLHTVLSNTNKFKTDLFLFVDGR